MNWKPLRSIKNLAILTTLISCSNVKPIRVNQCTIAKDNQCYCRDYTISRNFIGPNNFFIPHDANKCLFIIGLAPADYVEAQQAIRDLINESP
jgi:hypothetical protein